MAILMDKCKFDCIIPKWKVAEPHRENKAFLIFKSSWFTIKMLEHRNI